MDRWFTEFWGKFWNPSIVDELCAPDILLQYLLQAPYRGRAEVKTFMTAFREAFPDVRVEPAGDFVAEGEYVIGRWVGSSTHTGPAYCDFLVGCLPGASGQQMRFTGTTVLRVQNGKIAEQIGLDDEVTAFCNSASPAQPGDASVRAVPRAIAIVRRQESFAHLRSATNRDWGWRGQWSNEGRRTLFNCSCVRAGTPAVRTRVPFGATATRWHRL